MRKEQTKLMDWLKSGSAEICMIEQNGLACAYFRYQMQEGIDILYMYKRIKNGKIMIRENPKYQGLYDRTSDKLYDIQYPTQEIIEEELYQERSIGTFISEFENKVREIAEKMTEHLEDDEKTQKFRENNRSYAECEARKIYLNDKDTNFTCHCTYDENLFDINLIPYIINKEKTVQKMAETYCEENYDKIVEEAVRNLLIKKTVKELKQGGDKFLTCMRNIIKAIPAYCRTVNVTTVIADKEITFRYEAKKMRCDCGNHYSTWYIQSKDRREFEKLYGIHADFTPFDITKITYGKKVLYEKG